MLCGFPLPARVRPGELPARTSPGRLDHELERLLRSGGCEMAISVRLRLGLQEGLLSVELLRIDSVRARRNGETAGLLESPCEAKRNGRKPICESELDRSLSII